MSLTEFKREERYIIGVRWKKSGRSADVLSQITERLFCRYKVWGKSDEELKLQYNIYLQTEMFKNKIIYKDLKVRQRLREERGLQRQFTTYTFPEHLQSTETHLELDDASTPSPVQDWCIVQEQNEWEIEEFINDLCYYEIDSFEKELMVQVEKRTRLEQINADYLEKMGVMTGEEDVGGGVVKFQRLFRVKCFSKEQDAGEIKEVEERLQAVNFKD